MGARQLADQVQDCPWPSTGHGPAQAIDLGARIGVVVLAPGHTGAHTQEIQIVTPS
jgi:hypothetical protein